MGISTLKFFDLHNDTLYELQGRNVDIFDDTLSVSAKKIPEDFLYEAFFAIYTPDEYDLKKAYSQAVLLVKQYKKLKNKSIRKHLSLESARPLLAKDSLDFFIKNGLRLVSLTHNGDNEIASGCFTENDMGLTPLGKELVDNLLNQDITLDVAHASKKTFYDICEMTGKSFICSHTAARSIADHVRNLSKEQIKIINDRGGLIGICAYPVFLCLENSCKIDRILHQVEHFLSEGCEDTLCFGTDFDGIGYNVEGFEDISRIYDLKNELLKKHDEKLIDKIFYSNANRFFRKKSGAKTPHFV